MKKPLPRGSAVDAARTARWLHRFEGYRRTISIDRIHRWLGQFHSDHRDLAARILDSVRFVTHQDMEDAFRSMLDRMPGWSIDPGQRQGKWRFVAFSFSPGESGDTMLQKFRLATGLNARKFNELFIYKSDIPGANLGPDDTVVFVDDFAGTGQQACNGWRESLSELLPGEPSVYLMLVASSVKARARIHSETKLRVLASVQLRDDDNVFSSRCGHFSHHEKAFLLDYCTRASRTHPRGYGDCGFVIVLAHRTPNNSIAILHARNNRWRGLFPRHD